MESHSKINGYLVLECKFYKATTKNWCDTLDKKRSIPKLSVLTWDHKEKRMKTNYGI